jgi:uncharacterized protein YyaL (SSP411 family)
LLQFSHFAANFARNSYYLDCFVSFGSKNKNKVIDKVQEIYLPAKLAYNIKDFSAKATPSEESTAYLDKVYICTLDKCEKILHSEEELNNYLKFFYNI